MSNRKSKSLVQLSRRHFLGSITASPLLGFSSCPVAALFTTILGGQSQKAWAQSLGITPRTYVRILEGGAPSRWMYDSFLTPYSSEGFDKNPMVGTRFKNVGGRYIGIDYVTHTRRGIQVPTMWTYNLPAPNGQFRPMDGLLDNLLCIQGITTRNAGHEASQQWVWEPPGAKKSSSALSADGSDAPLAALNLNASSYKFKSTASKTFVNPSLSGNWLSNLLDPFKAVGTTQFKTNKAALREAYDGLVPLLGDLAKDGNIGAEAILQNRNSALILAETNFDNLSTQWTELVAKYQDLVTRSIYDPEHPLPGLTDLPIGEGGSSGTPLLYQLDSGQAGLNLHLLPDLRSLLTPETTVPGLAERFAFTEYVLMEGLSSSIAFSIGDIRRVVGSTTIYSMGNDQHNAGLYPQTLFNTLRHRAGAACLAELISQLKSVGKFDDTVICLSGEFNRNPKQDMTGSDHGWSGVSQAYYCGAIDGPKIIGLLTNDSRLGWGAGAITPTLGRQINLIDSIVTVAHLLRVAAPLTSASSLVTLGTNGLIANIPNTSHV